MKATDAETRRLCAALARLFAAEAGATREGEWSVLLAIQERAGAVISRLGRLELSAATAAEVGRLLARRQPTARLLAERRAAVQAELERITRARRQLLGLVPAYGPRAGGRGLTFAASA